MKKIILALMITLAAVSAVPADTITLRNGTTLRGNLLGFANGRFAVQLTMDATLPLRSNDGRYQTGTPSTSTTQAPTRTVRAGEVIFLRPRDIERIEIEGRSLDDARYQTRTVDVQLGPNWVDSGVDIKRGERVRIDASGTIYAGLSRITPAGLSSRDPYAPLPGAAQGTLLGVIGVDYNSPIIEIGASREFVADRDGRLYLTPNRSSYTDASGAYNVKVRKELDLAALARADENRNQNDNTFDPFGLPESSSTGQPGRIRSRQQGDYGRNRDNRNRQLSEKTVVVPGTEQRGLDTGVDLRAGDQVTITATGNITAGQRAGVVSPEGGRGGIIGFNTRPVPNAGVGALIGYIVSTNGQRSQPFYVGSQLNLTTPVDGRLYLLINDDNYSDNSGSFTARIIYPQYR